jgi:hypothetical protein
MNESDAKAALRAAGIFAPSRSLIENWLRAATVAEKLAVAEQGPIEAPSNRRETTPKGGEAAAETPIPCTDLNVAIRALEAQGIPTTHQAVLDWLAQHRPVQTMPAMPEEPLPAPQRSREEPPIAQTKGASKLARFVVPPTEAKRRRKRGRPLTVASWFPAVAETMADGTTMRTALAIHGLTLSANEMRSLYRNKTFKGLYQEARRRYLIENWGRSKPSLRAILGRCV